ncbi:hypothetical protein [Halorientalis litorea]|uniref:hypothetical protein n=1 Tax=Halorientalis litorea TaxID=2931977 RepID=UPI001FF1662E|nr:hypothetical protein [Halorientalis litorea]
MAGALRTDLRTARVVAAVEVRRSVRAVLTDRRQLLGFALLVAAFAPVAVLVASGSYVAGLRVGGGTDLPVVTLARAQVTAWLGSLTALFGLRMVERAGDIDHADLLLTTVRPRALVTGLLLAEYVRMLAVLGPPMALVVGAFAYGAGTPLLLPVAVLGVLPLLAVALLGGATVGYLLRIGYRRVGVGSGTRTVLGVSVALGLFLWLNAAAPADPFQFAASLRPLAAVPVGAYADLLLVPGPVSVTPGPASLVAVVVLVCTGTVLLVATWRLAVVVWYADPPAGGPGDATGRRLARAPLPGVPGIGTGTTLREVRWLWLRGVRSPSRFVHLLYFVFLTAPTAQVALAHPRSPALPVVVAVVGALLAGGTFGLNPLGMAGTVLPSVLTTPSPGRQFVRPRVLAGPLLWVPPTLVGVVVLGWYGHLTLTEAALLCVFAVVLAAFSSALAVALGTFSPRFEPVTAFGGVETATPTTPVLLGHTLGTGTAALLGLATVFVPALVDAPPFVGRGTVLAQLVGLGAWTLLVAVVAVFCYRYSVGRVETFVYE